MVQTLTLAATAGSYRLHFVRDGINHVTGAILHDYADPAQAPALRESRGGQLHSPYTEAWVRARIEAAVPPEQRGAPGPAARGVFAQLELDYGQASSNYSKLLINNGSTTTNQVAVLLDQKT